jgi:glycosyltransferase involved in cell wall biosynthesis
VGEFFRGNAHARSLRISMSRKFLTALPVFNEARHLNGVLDQVRRYSENILVVDDGSADETPKLLAERSDVRVARHVKNRGYGAALRTAFDYAAKHGFETIVTIDCDGQHEPCRIPQFVAACHDVDIVSGSRYLQSFDNDTPPPEQRRRINAMLTEEINRRLHLQLTDAFCGFKAYRVAALEKLKLTEEGYAMPLELWVQAVAAGLRIVELPVPLIYLDERRSFGGALDDAEKRMAYYREVLDRAVAAAGTIADGDGCKCKSASQISPPHLAPQNVAPQNVIATSEMPTLCSSTSSPSAPTRCHE